MRAPFVRLNEVQRLGHLDEEDTIVCKATGPGFTEGKRYKLTTETFDGRKVESRPRPNRGPDETEEVLVTGMELAILIGPDDNMETHCFTQFERGDKSAGDCRPAASHHHLLSELVAYFVIPDVPDAPTLNPLKYKANLARLRVLEN